MWVDCIQSVEGLNRLKVWSWGSSASTQPLDLNYDIASSRIPSLPAHSAEFRLASVHNLMRQFLKINLFLLISHRKYWSYFSEESWLIYHYYLYTYFLFAQFSHPISFLCIFLILIVLQISLIYPSLSSSSQLLPTSGLHHPIALAHELYIQLRKFFG